MNSFNPFLKPKYSYNKNFIQIIFTIIILILIIKISSAQTQSVKTIKATTEKSTKISTSTSRPKPEPKSELIKPVETTKIPTPPLKAKVTTETKWIEESLKKHNYFRSLHNSSPLKLNNTLSEISQSYANYLLERAIESYEKVKQVEYFEHNKDVLKNHKIGENLYYVKAYYSKINASLAVNLWYNEIKDYDFQYARVKATSPNNSMIGHFTQLVWNETNQMGTAYAAKKLPNNQTITFVVANYYPQGNVHTYGDFPLRLYLQNVLPPISDAENEVTNNEDVRDNIMYWDVPKSNLTTPTSWIMASVDKHNEYRRMFHVPEIKVNEDLCQVAQFWANYLLKFGIADFNRDFMVHRLWGNSAAINRANFGENMMYFISDGLIDPSYPVKLWFEEKRFYDFDHRTTNKTKSFTARTDHFERVVWKSTTHMGIAFATGELENGQILTFILANYYPSGNHHKSFEERVENVPYESNPFYTTIQQLMIQLFQN